MDKGITDFVLFTEISISGRRRGAAPERSMARRRTVDLSVWYTGPNRCRRRRCGCFVVRTFCRFFATSNFAICLTIARLTLQHCYGDLCPADHRMPWTREEYMFLFSVYYVANEELFDKSRRLETKPFLFSSKRKTKIERKFNNLNQPQYTIASNFVAYR